jgi:hypothetical protein
MVVSLLGSGMELGTGEQRPDQIADGGGSSLDAFGKVA